MSADVSPPAALRGRWLSFARVTWVAVAIMVLAIIVFSVPSSYEYYRGVCTAASEVCSERAVYQATQMACGRYGTPGCRCAPMRS